MGRAVLVLVWVLSSSPRSVRNTPTESWPPSPYALPPRCLTPSLSPTMPPSPCTSSLRTLTSASASTTKPFMTSASVPSSSPPPPTVTSTTSCPQLCLVSPAASASPVSSPPTSVTVATSPLPACSVAVCPPRKSMSRCSTSRTRTLPTSSSGSPTTSSPPSATSLPRASRCPPASLVILLPSRRCSSVCLSSSLACSAARLSFTGTPVKAWTRWSSPKPSPT